MFYTFLCKAAKKAYHLPANFQGKYGELPHLCMIGDDDQGAD